MRLTIPDGAPDKGVEFVSEELRTRSRLPASVLKQFGLRLDARLQITSSFPVFTLSLDDLIAFLSADVGSAGGKLDAWRYLVFQDEEPIVAVDILPTVAGQSLEFVALTSGPPIRNLVQLILDLERDPSNAAFQLRFLRIPGLLVRLLWLTGSEELFVPIEPRSRFLKERVRYTRPQLREALTAIANERIDNLEDELPIA